MRVLLAEDDDKVAAETAAALGAAGFLVARESEGARARDAARREDFAAIVLDLGLPDLDGLAVLKDLRAAGLTTPVLVLTARGSWMEKVAGIDAGADDYLAKPFQMEELIARTRALVRRAATGAPGAQMSAGEVSLEMRSKSVMVGGTAVALTAGEFRALAYLMANKGRVVPAGELKEHVHGSEAVSANALEALIARIRRKLGRNLIRTRRGLGYVIRDDA